MTSPGLPMARDSSLFTKSTLTRCPSSQRSSSSISLVLRRDSSSVCAAATCPACRRTCCCRSPTRLAFALAACAKVNSSPTATTAHEIGSSPARCCCPRFSWWVRQGCEAAAHYADERIIWRQSTAGRRGAGLFDREWRVRSPSWRTVCFEPADTCWSAARLTYMGTRRSSSCLVRARLGSAGEGDVGHV